MTSLRLLGATLVAGVAGCSLPLIGDRTSPEPPAVQVASADTGAEEPPIVQVRDYWRASVVTVVAWEPTDAAVGLRASVSRRGELVGGGRFGDHRLYLTPLYAQDMGGFSHAAVTPGKPLIYTGAQRDYYACFYGKKCSPALTLGVRVPDSLLRADRDSVVVTFHPRVREPWTITLRRELITAYLEKVDSVRAEFGKGGGSKGRSKVD